MKVAVQQQILFTAFRAVGIFRIFSVLQLVNRIPGLEILSCGTILRSCGGRAVFQAAVEYARHRSIPFLMLTPLWSETGDAFWRHCGFVEYGEPNGLWLHRKHRNGRCYNQIRQRLAYAISIQCALHGLEADHVVSLLLLAKTSYVDVPLNLWFEFVWRCRTERMACLRSHLRFLATHLIFL